MTPWFHTLLRIFITNPLLITLSLPLFAQPGPRNIDLDDVHYRIVGRSPERISSGSLLPFQDLLTKSILEIYMRYNIKIPSQFHVVLTTDAGAFLEQTGRDQHTPGLYDPTTDTLVFQNPMALERRGILHRVVTHELCHQVLHSARSEQQTGDTKGKRAKEKSRETAQDTASLLWLEESFCESLSPELIGGSGHTLRPPSSLTEFQEILERSMKGKDYRTRSEAYLMAGAWGSYLRRKMGDGPFFALLTKPISKEALRKRLQPFYEKFRRT